MGNLFQLEGGGGGGFLDPINLLGDDAFRMAQLETRSLLSPQQESLLSPLAQFAQDLLKSGSQTGVAALTQSLFKSGTAQAKRQAERIFSEALLGPSMRAFERDVAPRVSGGFARLGGTLSSRRDLVLTQGRTDVVKNAQSALASILPQIESHPLQQTLAQIQGLGALQNQRLAPFQAATNFALQPTRSLGTNPPGPGWELLGSFIGGAGGIAGLAAGSDRRLKENIVRIGEIHGIPHYRFEYTQKAIDLGIGELGVYEGIMADELGSEYPEKIFRGLDGFLRVTDPDFKPVRVKGS